MEELEKPESQAHKLDSEATPEKLEAKLFVSASVVFINNGTGNYINSINSVIGKYEIHTNNHTEQLIAILKAEMKKDKEV